MLLHDLMPPLLTRALRDLRRSVAGPKLHLDTHGRRFHHRGTPADLGVVEQIFWKRDYDLSRLARNLEIERFYATCERPLIVDAGANIGASAVWFATQFDRATVVAIEPAANNFALMETNVTGLNVRPVRGALASRPGRLQLLDPGEGEWAYRTGEGTGGSMGEVRAFALDELVPPGETPFILKIDIEGAEAEVFAAGSPIFDEFPVLIIELHDWMLPRSANSRAFLRWHCAQDRDFVHIGENVFSLCNRRLPALQ